jgi:hypothetical protein
MSSIAGLLRLASVVICLIVLASFAIFAVDQAKGASTHQQQALAKGAPSNTNGEGPSKPASASTRAGAAHKTIDETSAEGTVHKTVDEVSNSLTSPFSGVTAGSKSAWTIQSVDLLLALVVYGFGLGFLARVLNGRR